MQRTSHPGVIFLDLPTDPQRKGLRTLYVGPPTPVPGSVIAPMPIRIIIIATIRHIPLVIGRLTAENTSKTGKHAVISK